MGLYLPQVLLQALVRGSEQGSDAEAIGIFLVSDARLLQQRVQFLSDVRLHLVMTIALCESREELAGKTERERQGSERHKEAISIKMQGHIYGWQMMESIAILEQGHTVSVMQSL